MSTALPSKRSASTQPKQVARPARLLRSLCLAVCLVCLQQAHAQVVMFEQTLTIEPAVAADQIEILPVAGGKDWAFTARWDDNHANALNMQRMMSELGLKGTFYINKSTSKYDGEFARQLSADGCSLGGHTLGHYWLTTLNPNFAFREIVLNRIQREAETDYPINSFALPFGTYWDRNDTTTQADISESLIRSGFHHSVYAHFGQNRRYFSSEWMSTMNQVVPGDRRINEEKFRGLMAKILADPAHYQKVDYSISLGVHPWQSAEELAKLKGLLSDYAGRDDFWYCSQTEFAAYRLSAKNTTVEPVSGQPGVYRLTRPNIDTAGDAVPLSIAILGQQPRSITLDGQALEPSSAGDQRWLVNLPYTQSQAMPQRIDWVQFDGAEAAQLGESPEFEGLAFRLSRDASGDYLVTIVNNRGEALTGISVTLRKPLFYEEGLDFATAETIPPGQEKTLRFAPGPIRKDIRYLQGQTVAVAEVNIHDAKAHGRVYLTLDLVGPQPDEPTAAAMIRDHVRLAGPFDPEAIDFEPYVQMSKPDSELTALPDTPLSEWWTIAEDQAPKFAHSRAYPFSSESGWKSAARKFERKPAYFVVSADFKTDAAGVLKIRSELPVVELAVDGKRMPLSEGATAAPLSPGTHRAIMLVDTQSKMVFYKVRPFYLELTIAGDPVSYR